MELPDSQAFFAAQADGGNGLGAPASAAAAEVPPLRTGAVSSPEAEPEPVESFHVLIAGADPASLQTMQDALESEGYVVTSVPTGVKAVAESETSKPDIVLVDVDVPMMNGYEVCRKIRERHTPNDLPVILTSNRGDPTVTSKGMAAGANDLIEKPFVPEEFIARIRTHLNLARITAIYSRFLPTELLDFLGHKNVTELRLGDQTQREMTVLFVDIRSFTSLSERMTPQENFKFINSYLSRITPLIRAYNGFVDKYIGDAVMALFPGRPEDAIKSAISMVDYLTVYNGYRAKSGYRPINIGVGIHTGNLILGIIGDSERMQGTVISDAVNLASRVQDVTKLYGSNIIISQDTFVRLQNPTDFNFRFLGKVKVKGKVQTVSLFEIFDGDDPARITLKSGTKSDFEEAILLFSKRRFGPSAELFRSIVSKNPDDRAASLFLDRAELLLKREKANWLLK